ncbi:MAG: hypothetical protein KME17_04330 [Cyanosarcina radialis HA8281-LM2]|jgi:hypothetical protein|nr:hypothetical protein [Cyanosarcina radialis HA8281-LM2]
MVNWNYRVFWEANGDYIIREVFYAEDGSIIGCTENAVEPCGQSLEKLAKDLEWFQKALALPVLKLDEIPDRGRKRQNKRSPKDNISHEQLMAELGLGQPSATS